MFKFFNPNMDNRTQKIDMGAIFCIFNYFSKHLRLNNYIFLKYFSCLLNDFEGAEYYYAYDCGG